MNHRPNETARICRFAASGLASLAIAVLSAAGGCSPDAPLPDEMLAAREAPVCEVTYQNFAAEFFGRYCLRCHNADLEGDLNRFDAPTGIDFNTLSSVRPFQNRISLRAGLQGDMPPKLLDIPQPTDEERLLLIQWIDCGTPQE